MGIKLAIECDGCKTLKKETNHWYMINYTCKDHEVGMHMRPFNLEEVRNDSEHFFIFCGQACAMKFVSENLDQLW